ncbi:DUF3857 domain-containing transglutaminase family protein [Vulgatibacter incomptus]|uniref:Transglutaminase-like enzyme n=1 Tax=Vulgatibacter incomptus TaxID=1391653 RepID=A0A0K1PHR4_9BACT|nr:DUF3857 domain-containing transglutaminase family protein [Vulgatibacter incomptus]AKU93065.1 Transglutaminase-like enzyme [Vulgatibacter incomptus]
MKTYAHVVLAAALLFGCATTSTPSPGSPTPIAESPVASRIPDESRPDAPAPVGFYRMRTVLRLEADGTYRTTFEERYVVLSASVPGYFGQLSAEFDPAQDEVPVLEAKVTLPDGTVKELDPATIAKGPATSSSADNFSDRLRVVAPLPAIVPGSIVQRSWTLSRNRPTVSFGNSFALPMASMLTSDEASAVVEHPVGLPLKVQAFATPSEHATEELEGGRIRLTWTRSSAPSASFANHLPPWSRRYPAIFVSTARSWQDVARGYRELVGPALDPAPLQSIAAGLKPASKAPRDVAAAALDWMHHNLRYTGLDFGNAGVVPHTPSQTLERGYGDCKDLAAFLVALLDAAGLEARIALVNTGSLAEGPAELPGLQRFDHAIVVLPGKEPLWMDPTMRGMPPGVLDDLSVGRLALVVDSKTTAPIRTPLPPAEANRAVIRTEVTLPESGLGTIRKTRTLAGTALSGRRYRAIWQTEDQVKRAMAADVAQIHSTSDFDLRYSDPLSARAPFEEVIEIRRSSKAEAADSNAVASLGFSEFLGLLPSQLVNEDDDDEGPDADVFLGAPAELEMVTRVRVHPIFRLQGGSVSRTGEAAGIHWSYAVEPTDDGAEARLWLRIDVPEVRAENLPAVRSSLNELLSAPDSAVFDNRILQLLEEGKVATAAAELRELIRKEPKSAWLQALLARTALAASLGAEAHRLAKAAAEAAPGAANVLRAEGWILSHDKWGKRLTEGMDRKGAVEALTRARKLDPESWTRGTLIDLLSRDGRGSIGGAGADVDRALEELRSFRKEVDDRDDELYFNLLWKRGLDDELIAEAEKSKKNWAEAVAAKARRDGAAAALAWVDRQNAGVREPLLAGATYLLFTAREYPLARSLASRVGDPRFETMKKWLNRLERRETSPLRRDDPVELVAEAMALSLGANARVTADEIGLSEASSRALEVSLRPVITQYLDSAEAFVDLARTIARVKETREIPGIGVLVAIDTEFSGSGFDLCERGRSGLRYHPIQSPTARVAEAWKALEAKDSAKARAWLDLCVVLDSKLKRREPTIRRLMKGSDDDLALGIALAHGDSDGELERMLPVLARAYGNLPSRRDDDIFVGYDYLNVLVTSKRFDDALGVVARLEELGLMDEPGEAASTRVFILGKAERPDALEALARELLERDPVSKEAFRALSWAADLRGDWRAARDIALRMADAGVGTNPLNDAAWTGVFLGVQDEDIRRAEVAIGPKADKASALDTLAVLLAEKGEVDRALRILARQESLDPTATSWSNVYVRARIAEALGFREAAIELYRSVKPARSKTNDLHGLAVKRLEALGAR